MEAPPKTNEIEVSVFGPGYGECIVVHIGSGRWLVVDSCKTSGNAAPVALRYFEHIGVNASEQAELVAITHWHDDHIRGASEIVEVCKSAAVCVSDAFTRDEFKKFLSAFSTAKKSEYGTGVDEFVTTLEHIRELGRRAYRGSQDKRILNVPSEQLAHGSSCEVWTLSPSDFQTMESEARFASLIPEARSTIRRATPGSPNNHSVAMWIAIGDVHIILGADLERTADPRAGWESVVSSTNRPNGEVSLFKVPHHGSENAHHDGLWATVLRSNVNAIVTPWNRNAGLPTATDLERLGAATANLFITAPSTSMVRARHEHSVERMMREFQIKTKRHPFTVGAVTARLDYGSDCDWAVTKWELPPIK